MNRARRRLLVAKISIAAFCGVVASLFCQRAITLLCTEDQTATEREGGVIMAALAGAFLLAGIMAALIRR